MEDVPVGDLTPGMRLDETLCLAGGELVLWRGQAVDDLVLSALAACGVTELFSCADAEEVRELALNAGREPVPLDEFPEGACLPWGLYEAGGRKLLAAGGRLRPHQRSALRASGVDAAFEPASDLAPRVARKRRVLARALAPRRGAPSSPVTWQGWLARPWGSAPRAPSIEGIGSRPADAVAKAFMAHAVLASEVEAVMDDLALGLSLDVPRAVEAARAAVVSVHRAPFVSVACSIEALSSGRLRDHAAASATVAAAAARAAGRREDDCLEPAACALLHDAAMSWVREDLLAEKGPLSEAGRRAVRRHPLRALKTLADADGLAPSTSLAALQIHERLDGGGYPLGLRGDELLPGPRLVAAVDVLCALLAPRPHRRELAPRESMDICVRLAGEGKLDGEAVRALLRAVGLFPVGSAVWLSTGELARVIATSGDDYERPVVSVIRTAGAFAPEARRVMDLSARTDISIDRAARAEEAPWEGEAGF